jgi:hypothetical protein
MAWSFDCICLMKFFQLCNLHNFFSKNASLKKMIIKLELFKTLCECKYNYKINKL